MIHPAVINRMLLPVFALLLAVSSVQSQSVPSPVAPVPLLSNPSGSQTVPPEMMRPQTEPALQSAAAPLTTALVPDSYTLSAGDGLLITVTSQTYTQYAATVTPEGKVIIPTVGAAVVKQLTLQQAKTRISKLLAGTFRQAEVSVSLISLRTFNVTVMGEVKQPAALRVTAAERVSDALIRSEAFKRSDAQTASMRRIELRRTQPDTTVIVDLFRFMRLGDQRANPFLKEGDVIFIPKFREQAAIYGEVRAPGVMEYVSGDSLYTYIRFAQGIDESSAFLDSVEVIRYNADRITTRSLTLNLNGFPASANIALERDDLVLIRRISQWHEPQTVSVFGEVKFPSTYRVVKGQTRLRDIIGLAGGFTRDASLEEAVVIRGITIKTADADLARLRTIGKRDMSDDEYEYIKARSREKQGQMSVSFADLYLRNKESENIFIEPGDVIEVPKFKNYVNVIGRVLKPGNIEYRYGLTARDYIAAAGGLGWRADTGDLRVIKVRTGEWVNADRFQALEPGDTVWVPEKPDIKFWEVFRDVLLVAGSVATLIIAVRSLTQ